MWLSHVFSEELQRLNCSQAGGIVTLHPLYCKVVSNCTRGKVYLWLLFCPVLTVLWMTPHRILFVSAYKDSAVLQVICILEISRNCRETSGFPQLLRVCLRAAGIAQLFKVCHSNLAKELCWSQLHTGWSERTMIVYSPEIWKGIVCSMVTVTYPALPGW